MTHGLPVHEQTIILDEDYPDMSRFALVYFVMLHACGDAGMVTTDLDSRDTRPQFPATVTVPTDRPFHLPVDDTPAFSHQGFLFRRSNLRPTKKNWCILSGKVLKVYADWNKHMQQVHLAFALAAGHRRDADCELTMRAVA